MKTESNNPFSEFYWKNFNLGEELNISGSFIYNAIYFFDQMVHFYNEADIFEFFYNTSVGIERLEKIAVILLQHKDVKDQTAFEKQLKTHNHKELLEKIKKNVEIKFDKKHNEFISLLTNFYKSTRYHRFSLSNVQKPSSYRTDFIYFIKKRLNIKTELEILELPNDDNIKIFIGEVVGTIVSQLYDIIHIEASNQNLYTYELPYDSKAYKIFMRKEFNFLKERNLKKELLVFLVNNKDQNEYISFLKTIEPLKFDDALINEYISFLLNPHIGIDLIDEMEYLQEEEEEDEGLDDVRSYSICYIGDNIQFDFDEE